MDWDMWLDHHRIAEHYARRFAERTGTMYEDVLMIAEEGMERGIGRYDPSRGTKPATVIVQAVIGELQNRLRTVMWSNSLPMERGYEHRFFDDTFDRLLSPCNPTEQTVLRSIYQHGDTLTAIASSMGCSVSTIKRTRDSAIGKVRSHYGSRA